MIQIEPEQFPDPHWRHYRKEWDDDHGVWKDRPRHDDSSHGADAFLTIACSDYEPPRPYKPAEADLTWVV